MALLVAELVLEPAADHLVSWIAGPDLAVKVLNRAVVELVLAAVGAGCAVLEACSVRSDSGGGSSGEAHCEGEGDGDELHGSG